MALAYNQHIGLLMFVSSGLCHQRLVRRDTAYVKLDKLYETHVFYFGVGSV